MFYVGGVVLFFRAVTGRVHWTLLCVTFLLPLRNVVDKLQAYPLGNQFLDILIVSIIVGGSFRLSGKRKILENTSINVITVFLILYSFISLIIGAQYLGLDSFFDISDPRVQSWKTFCLLPVLYFITVNNVRDKKEVWRVFYGDVLRDGADGILYERTGKLVLIFSVPRKDHRDIPISGTQ